MGYINSRIDETSSSTGKAGPPGDQRPPGPEGPEGSHFLPLFNIEHYERNKPFEHLLHLKRLLERPCSDPKPGRSGQCF